MKNLFNNLSEEEKKSILEQHYQNKENVNEQLVQRAVAGAKGAARRVASRVADMTQTGVEPNPKLDANARKLFEWNDWIAKYLNQFQTNLKKIQADIMAEKTTVPQHTEQKNYLSKLTSDLESVLSPFITTTTQVKADETSGKGIYRKDTTTQPAQPAQQAAPAPAQGAQQPVTAQGQTRNLSGKF